MFEPGFDQAEGLKRLFRPLTRVQWHVVAMGPVLVTAPLAMSLGRCLTEQGLDIGCDDPSGLLGPVPIAPASQPTTQVVITASRAGSDWQMDSLRRQSMLVIARPRPDELPALYAAIKRCDARLEQEPVQVVWDCARQGSDDESLRQLCEQNLVRTCQRFLDRHLQFSTVDDGAAEGDPAGIASLARTLSGGLINRLGLVAAVRPGFLN
ncbi:MAG: hypothetical protein R3E68_06800 [Burkholderiaceae bacterium]